MPLAKTDVEHIEELVEKLFEKKLISSRDRDEEKQESPSPFLSERALFERILNIESEIKALHIEIKNRGELLEKILHQIDKRFEQVDKRFEEMREDMNKRFEQMDRRFEQVDKRFEEMREDMNKRFEEMREDMNKRFEEMREDMNKRSEQIDKRFSQLFWFIGLFIPLSNTLLLLGLTYIIK